MSAQASQGVTLEDLWTALMELRQQVEVLQESHHAGPVSATVVPEMVVLDKKTAAMEMNRIRKVVEEDWVETPVSKKRHYNPPLTLAEAKVVIAERIRRKENGETIEDSSREFAGCLNGKNIFKGDPVEIQRKMRDEWD
jgi:hypothetical protein